MPYTAFPLRLRNGFLTRCAETDSFLRLLEVMARTPKGSWAGCAHFGMRGYFEQAHVYPEMTTLAVQELNRTLQDLGLTEYKVESIDSEAGGKPGEYVFGLSFTSRRQGALRTSLRLSI